MDNILQEGVVALISGMGIVFLVLILIAIIIWLFKFIQQPQEKVIEVVPAQVTTHEEEQQTDDLELIAVITAAIAAQLDTSTDKLQVKSFRKIGSNRSRW
ncbi:OadG family protein [Vallitalea pronyensis]|uniref:OadG family protein n=1 Tax=Vallitalea pronyensis TaxID=1348613 RepID=A0A8J8MKB8_9FIRM|nr:OadG family transporter subunit [Vallitalea pronyensis]QUI23091.1 OadG family protein [Vallitalea pronyensis]